jgi:hypothetical protein
VIKYEGVKVTVRGRAVSTLNNSTGRKCVLPFDKLRAGRADSTLSALGRQYAGGDPHFPFDKGL